MIQAILELFTTEQKAEAMLANPIIELIFLALFFIFVVTLLVHLSLFMKLRKLRSHLKETNNMKIEPLRSFKEQFDKRQETESIKAETFVQERFSSWRVWNMPVVSLIKLVQMTVSVFILLGVLGTFIGLTISLGSIQTAEDQLVENVTGVLSGIDVAFYTSIVGMSFSLLMTILVKALNTEYMLTDIMLMVETQLEGHEQNGLSRLIGVSETINQSILRLQETNQQSLQSIEKAFTGFQEYTTGLQQSARDLAAFNEGLSRNVEDFQELFQQMKMVTDGFSEGTTQLNKNFAALFAYFKKADRRNERMATAFEQTYERMQEVFKTQRHTFSQFEESVHDIKSFTSSLLEEQGMIQATFERITQKNDELVKKMGAHNQEFKKVFGSDLSGRISGITTQLSKLSTGFDQLGDSITPLPHALEVINQTQNEYKHLLLDRFRELEEFNQTFSQHLKDHSTQSATFEKNMLETSRTYEQMGAKNNQVITEMNTILSHMNQTFHQRDQQLETNVGLLKETLSNYVSSLEGTLGDKLDKVARNISESIDLTTNGMKREFTEIRRGSEEIQQNSFRSIQQLLQELGQEFQTLNRGLSSLNRFGRQTVPANSAIGSGLNHNDY
ncbi:MotA/TolQ/ExbB proton channel family protein [Lederbergia sp. NSJ-179]|uniref:MotA/TolQ/ExbB proton channel family protein n=1 Tax=Lederbergia sp. NSJ-179 TaxID=2931402 RepID=UPI001FD2B2D9|nr:MotA/TolQ/ExbB proton channel family protein [Lederbergia sp. NSJ-179]MCJ7840841.1 MotA/TolQ/ExbB proton channel family protein [Lederbergia sp. NSJ-179]